MTRARLLDGFLALLVGFVLAVGVACHLWGLT